MKTKVTFLEATEKADTQIADEFNAIKKELEYLHMIKQDIYTNLFMERKTDSRKFYLENSSKLELIKLINNL